MAMTYVPPPGNLPARLSSFIGRERDRNAVSGFLAGCTTRLVTLTGAGGCGKTRLSLAVADQLAAEGSFPYGAWFVQLAAIDAPHLVLQTVAATLGVPAASEQPPFDDLSDFLRDKEMLMILDNCEHLLPACADLARALLDACPRLSLLATSREPLGLPDETVWLVPSLALPGFTMPASLKQLLAVEAMQLFAARASAVLPAFAITEDNAATVARICRRLDGIPLAIELAAARVKMLAVEQIAARLEDGLHLLTRGSRQAPARHQTMRAALDWATSCCRHASRACSTGWPCLPTASHSKTRRVSAPIRASAPICRLRGCWIRCRTWWKSRCW